MVKGRIVSKHNKELFNVKKYLTNVFWVNSKGDSAHVFFCICKNSPAYSQICSYAKTMQICKICRFKFVLFNPLLDNWSLYKIKIRLSSSVKYMHLHIIRGLFITKEKIPYCPTNTQAVERMVKLMSNVSQTVVEEKRDGASQLTLESRGVMPKFSSKQNFCTTQLIH